MKTQTIQDYNGVPTGVFIPMENWNRIKKQFPDIEKMDNEIPQWEKDLIDNRLNTIAKSPERLRPIEELFEELNRKI